MVMKDNKYEKILSISTKLFSAKGFEGTTFQEIADKAGLHKSTLFHYLKDKEELLLRIIERSFGEVNLNLRKIISDNTLDPEDKFRKAVENHLISIIKNIDSVNVYLNDVRSLSKKNQKVYMETRKSYERDFRKIVAGMKTKGYFDGLDSKIVTFGILGMLNSVLKWYRKDGPLTIEEVSGIFDKMITKK